MRVLALLAAVALVVGAVVVRSRLDDRQAVTTGPTTTAAPTGEIVCDTALAAACAALAGPVVTEPAGATITRLSAPGADRPRAWVTLAPLPQVLDEARRVNGLAPLFATGRQAAGTELVLVARADRGQVLAARCGAVDWRCLGDSADRSWTDLGGDPAWKRVRIGHSAPDRTGIGALVFAWAAAGYTGAANVAVDDVALRGWLSQLERAVPDAALSAGSPLQLMVTQLGSVDVVAATAAEAATIVGPATSRAAGFTIYPADMAEARVVVAGTSPADGATVAAAVRPGLVSAGWGALDGEAPGAVPGLPSPGAIQALRTRVWQEVR